MIQALPVWATTSQKPAYHHEQIAQAAVGRFRISCPCLHGSRLTWEEPLKRLQLLAMGTKEALIRSQEHWGCRRRQERGSKGPASANQTDNIMEVNVEEKSRTLESADYTVILSKKNKMYMRHKKSTFSFLTMPSYLSRHLSPVRPPAALNTSRDQTPLKSKRTSHKDKYRSTSYKIKPIRLTDVPLSVDMNCNEIHLTVGARPEERLWPKIWPWPDGKDLMRTVARMTRGVGVKVVDVACEDIKDVNFPGWPGLSWENLEEVFSSTSTETSWWAAAETLVWPSTSKLTCSFGLVVVSSLCFVTLSFIHAECFHRV